ncbi:MAG TPA: tyrosine--tRNA ligase [Bacteroidales bacterium]|jgi:tyrosyl-tRNA synthetase|nr:tyrosine--tRNA ligase [Bacteroidales bacterium]OQC57474.1 MAG: Tyrosine--tRNA ligase [Bacteroidetes bacterium ADurb.Bin013]MBP8999219.1 tyrosine--tRNA ligase [Bacteroidales bacterium]MBV6455445.1 Tyrosine--tRNA ligase [Bacteroidales bacterium]MCZ2316298.1 tyrosine--tRNA ligase [Bacteroidales bacterium]
MKKNNFVEELTWRGMIHDIMPGTEELLNKEMTTAYVGIDPTADSLHIGHLVSVMMLKHFQVAGHRPIALIGGATGMIGDPSMKSSERNLLDEKTLRHNQECIRKQLIRFLDFDDAKPNGALLLNNYDWTKDYSFLHFVRDIGKHVTVNYMMSKESVRKRLSGEETDGMSFTEFSYQLLQAYDFLYLYSNYGCKLQMGGSDQWGNITTGTELIRRKQGGEGYALTCPLITKSDGGKFGKTESGNVWLDPGKTTPYAFYQFWMNVSDEDAGKYIKIFTLLPRETIEKHMEAHRLEPHKRLLQSVLAEYVTKMVHGEEEYNKSVTASRILFGGGTREQLMVMDEGTFLSVFDGVPQFELPASELPLTVVDLLAVRTSVMPSKGECRKLIQGGGLSLNKEKVVSAEMMVDRSMLLQGKYLLVQKGKKNYFIIKAS